MFITCFNKLFSDGYIFKNYTRNCMGNRVVFVVVLVVVVVDRTDLRQKRRIYMQMG